MTKKKTNKTKKILYYVVLALFIAALLYLKFSADSGGQAEQPQLQTVAPVQAEDLGENLSYADFNASSVPEYSGSRSVTVNGNVPFFTQDEIEEAKKGSFERYGKQDKLGRCTAATGCLGRETMPAKGEKRGDISAIHPTGWKQARYDCVDAETIMTRAHLIAWMLGAENDNERNLITGTRYMNSDGMLDYESEVQDYLYNNKKAHVLYRVTPVFTGSNLMADGVLMEACSVEDGGKAVRFCVYVYNVQPGIALNYANGKSAYTGIFFDTDAESVVTDDISLGSFTLDRTGNTIHTPFCKELENTDKNGRIQFAGDKLMIDSWKDFGYNVCTCITK